MMFGFSKNKQKPEIELCKTESDGYPQDHYKNAFYASTNSYNEYVKSEVVDKKNGIAEQKTKPVWCVEKTKKLEQYH